CWRRRAKSGSALWSSSRERDQGRFGRRRRGVRCPFLCAARNEPDLAYPHSAGWRLRRGPERDATDPEGGRAVRGRHEDPAPDRFFRVCGRGRAPAVRLVEQLNVELVLVHVVAETPLCGEGLLNIRGAQPIYDAQRKWAEDTLEARCGTLRLSGIKAHWRLEVGVPFEEIVKAAEEEHADMIVMGTHGRSGYNRLLLGSVVGRVIHLAPCPVLTVRHKKAGAV